MAQIDTSIYGRPMSASQGLASLAGGFQSIKDSKMQDLAIQQREIALQQLKDKQARDAQFRQDYQDMGYTPGMSDPRELQDLYRDSFPMEVAKQQMKQSQNPLAMMKYEQSQERLDLQRKEAERRLKAEGRKTEKDAFMKDYKTKSLKLREKGYDRGIQEFERTMAEKIRDQDWDESKIAREQVQLQGKINPAIQKYKMPGKVLDQIEVRRINEGTGATGNLLALTGDLTSQINKYGLQKVKGANKARMESSVRAIATSLNNPMFVNSGVMSEGELKNLKEMVGDPTDWLTFTEGEAKSRMESLQKFIQSKYVNSLNAYGIDGAKAYKEIQFRSKDFFKKMAKVKINEGGDSLSPEEESWVK